MMKSARTGRRGYTAVEVMVALTLFAIGAAGMITVQQTAVAANQDARQLDLANSIARTWVERLRRDSAMWTMPNSNNPSAPSNLANAKLLNIVNSTNNQQWNWIYPDSAYYQPTTRAGTDPDGLSPAFDILGRDLAVSEVLDAYFCVQVRADWLVNDQLMRAEVRVFYPNGRNPSFGRGCDFNNLSLANWTWPPDYYFNFVYASTAIRKNAQL